MDKAKRNANNIIALELSQKPGLTPEERQEIIRLYTGLGGLVETEHQGLAGLDQARKEGYCQFFSPPVLGELIADLLKIPDGATVLEPSIGSGSLVFNIQDRVKITGIEIEEQAFTIAQACLPGTELIRDSLINYKPKNCFDYVIANPPYSMILTDELQLYQNVNWERHIESHLACLEMSIEAVQDGGFVAIILPENYLEASDTFTFHRWLNKHARLLFKIGLPGDTFEATEWKTTLFVYQKATGPLKVPEFNIELSSLGPELNLDKDFKNLGFDYLLEKIDQYAFEVTPSSEPIKLEPPPEIPKAKVLINKLTLPIAEIDQVQIITRSKQTILKPLTLGALLKLAKIEATAEKRYDRKNERYTNLWLETLRKPLILKKSEIYNRLAQEDLELVLSQSEGNKQVNFEGFYNKETTPYSRVIRKNGNGNGEESYWETIPGYHEEVSGRWSHLFREKMKQAKKLHLDEWLYPFQLFDLCRMSMKQNNFLAYQQGLGKTRTVIALQILYGSEKGLYIAPSKLLGEWENELKTLGFRQYFDYRVIESFSDCKKLLKFNLISYENLWRIPKDSPYYKVARLDVQGMPKNFLRYTFSDILKKEFSFVCLDECYYIKNPKARRTEGVFNIRSKHKMVMTGTPIKGYPQNILGILNWCFGCGSALLPDYSYYEEGGVKRFIDRFGTYIMYDNQHAQTGDKGKKKQIPKIKDIEGFYKLLEAKMIRRLKNEPEVAEVITTNDPELKFIDLNITAEHRKFYQAWLDRFKEWYEARLQEEKMEGKKLGQMEILGKLGYLIQVACCPQSSHLKQLGAEETIATYEGGLTELQRWIIDKARQNAKEGNKVIIFSRYLDSLDFLASQMKDLKPMIINGSISLKRKKRSGKSKRQEMIEDFRYNGHKVLLAGTQCLCEGMNIPEANIGIFVDFDWTPSIMFQALFRMVRPQQKKQVIGYFLNLRGTIYEYMKMIVQLKQKSIDEGIDYQNFELNLDDIPDIRQYCKALMDAENGTIPKKRLMYLVENNQKEEE